MKVRRDHTEREIVAALRKCGALVVPVSTSRLKGAPDLFVAFWGRWFALECKSKGGRLSSEQKVMRDRAPIDVVTTPEEALRAIGAIP